MIPNDIAGTLGLARRAGKLSIGHDAAEEAILSKKAALCLLASDASERLKAEMARTAQHAGAEITVWNTAYTKVELAKSIGTKEIAVCTIDDAGFAQAIKNKSEGMEGHDEKI